MQLRESLFLWLLLIATAGWSQHYPILPVPNAPHGIVAMMQDSKSRIWIGTADDVLCFDGARFYSIRQYGFPKEEAKTLAEDSEGGIWIGTQGDDVHGGKHEGALYRYKAGRVEKILRGDVQSVVAVAKGYMLATIGVYPLVEYGDLYRFSGDHDSWRPEKMFDGTASSLSVDHQGAVLYPCPNLRGWCELSRQQVIDWTPQSANPNTTERDAPNDTARVLRDKFGCIWLRSQVAASYQCPGQALVTLPDAMEGLDSTQYLSEAPDGSILMFGGFAFGRPGAFKTLGLREGLPMGIRSAVFGRDGTMWLGGENGLFRFMYPFRMESWNDREDGNGGAYALLPVNGRVYAGGVGVTSLDSNRKTWTKITDGESTGSVVGLMPGPQHTLYAASLIRGVEQISADGKLLAQSSLMSGGDSLATDRDGRVWLGGTGISQVVRSGPKLTLVPEPLHQEKTLDMSYDRSRDLLWACYGHGVAVRKAGQWTLLGPSAGLTDDLCRSVAAHPNGDLWIAYNEHDGFSLLKGAAFGRTSIRNYSAGGDIGEGGTGFIGVDRQGWVWRGTAHKNYVASPENAEAGKWIELDQQDGIPDAGGNQNSFFGDPDGSIWFANDDIVVHFAPPPGFATDFTSPSVFVSGLSAGNEAVIFSESMSAIAHGEPIMAHIGSLQFDRRNAIRLRYRLLPEQSDWRPASGFDLALGKLHWGTHRLQVQAKLSTGPWSEITEEPFTVFKPLWVTWPAIAGYIVALFSGTFGFSAWRRSRVARANIKFPDLADWRLAALSPELSQVAGTIIEARFEVGPILARGGFATVARGRDLEQQGLLCAIKIFRQELMDRDWLARRFQHEVRALAAIDHPNVVRIYGHGATASGTPYLVMEFIEGITLRERLEQGRISPRTTASYLRQTGNALDEIHSHGICHRDLKPENLMIRNEAVSGKEVVLIDFSIAIVKDPDETMHGLSRAAGTLYYMAPEQAIGYADSSTDIYSLAKVVIEMLTGRRLSDLLPNASMDLSERVRELLADLPMHLRTPSIELLSSALEFDPARRPKLAGVFAETIATDLELSADQEQRISQPGDRV